MTDMVKTDIAKYVSPQPTKRAQKSLSKHIVAVGILAVILVGCIGGWAATTELSSAVVANGTVVVDNNVKKIQHLTGGIVGELLVREGQKVDEGQILVKLDGTTVRANLSIVQNNLAQLYARRARLLAERIEAPTFEIPQDLTELTSPASAKNLEDGERKLFASRQSAMVGMKMQLASRKDQLKEEGEGLQVQISAIDDSLGLINEELSGLDSLYKQGLVSIQRLVTLKRDKAQLDGDRGARIASLAQTRGKADEIDLQILQLGEDRRSEISKEMTEVEGNIAEFEDRRISAADQLKRLDIRAPITGTVYQLAVHTVNGVVNPGEVLMLLAPATDTLTVEAKVAPRDIDQVHLGQKVEVRFSAFNQRTTPEVDGEVTVIAPDITTEDRTGVSYYRLRVLPSAESLAKIKSGALYPGMPADVYIKVADRNVISYFTKPLTDQLKNTFREE